MEICHSQPHLVPPMKLVFYGDLPSPGGHDQSRSSLLPPWVQETKSLASRASQRASVLLTRKKTHSRPVIGAPTDFRRVEPLSRRRASFRPLELSIYLPGNRLSDLPEFSRFDLDTPGQPSPPVRALMSPFDSSGHFRRDSGPFQFSRKPVGSAPSRRGSVATADLQLQQAQTQRQPRQSMDANLTSPLVPHFSMVHTSNRHPLSLPPQKRPLLIDGSVTVADAPSSSKTTQPAMTRGSLDHQRTKITGKRQPGQIQPLPPVPRPSSSSRNNTPTINHHSAKSSSTFQSHSRMRTTSNSTVSSRTPSLSSAITAATTIFPSDKEIDGPPTTALPMIPASAKNSVVVEEPHVLDEQRSLSSRRGGYEFDQRFPLSPVGIAF